MQDKWWNDECMHPFLDVIDSNMRLYVMLIVILLWMFYLIECMNVLSKQCDYMVDLEVWYNPMYCNQ